MQLHYMLCNQFLCILCTCDLIAVFYACLKSSQISVDSFILSWDCRFSFHNKFTGLTSCSCHCCRASFVTINYGYVCKQSKRHPSHTLIKTNYLICCALYSTYISFPFLFFKGGLYWDYGMRRPKCSSAHSGLDAGNLAVLYFHF